MSHPSPILVYHKVQDCLELGITTTTIRQFRLQMSYLHQKGYRTLRVGEWFGFFKNGQFPQKTLTITFDDGYESIYHNAFPVMEEYGFVSTVFVVVGFVGRENSWDANLCGRKFSHLTWKQMEAMARYGHSFQSHTVNHPDLCKLSPSQIRYELGHSRELLEDKMGMAVEFLACPFGRANSLTREIAKKTGYKAVFGQTPKGGDYSLNREGMYLIDNLWDFRQKLGQGRFLWGERLKGKFINFFAQGTPLIKRLPDYKELGINDGE